MKRLKIWGSIVIFAVVVATIAIGIISCKTSQKSKSDLLSVMSIIKTLEKHDISLKADMSISSNQYELNGVIPAVYSLGEKKGILLIYTFRSFVERENAVRDSGEFNDKFSFEQSTYNARNAFLVYKAPIIPTTAEEIKPLRETTVLLSDIVFNDLNNGKVRIYEGESTSWKGTFTLKYYEHWWQDEAGKYYYENYSIDNESIRYKMSDVKSVGSINFEYETTGSSGKLTEVDLDRDGSLNLRGSGSNSALPSANESIIYKVKWNGKEENIVLKAQS